MYVILLAPLAQHLEREGVEYIQFSFRWMNCLLMREISIHNIVRMWDTYLVSYWILDPDYFYSGYSAHITCRPRKQTDFQIFMCMYVLRSW
jgi:hypothetical protein